MSEKKEAWDEHLPFILLSVRTSVQSSLKMTPFKLLYGVPPRLEATSRKRKHDWLSGSKDFETDRIKAITKALTATREEAVKNLKAAQERQKKAYDDRRKPLEFRVGDLVLKRNFSQQQRKGAKDEDAWKGPFKIVSSTGNGSYVLEKDGKRLGKTWNGASLKKYNAKEVENEENEVIELE